MKLSRTAPEYSHATNTRKGPELGGDANDCRVGVIGEAEMGGAAFMAYLGRSPPPISRTACTSSRNRRAATRACPQSWQGLGASRRKRVCCPRGGTGERNRSEGIVATTWQNVVHGVVHVQPFSLRCAVVHGVVHVRDKAMIEWFPAKGRFRVRSASRSCLSGASRGHAV